MKTYQAKPTEVERKWYVLDASEVSLGRLASKAAKLLTGKEKPMFTSHIDCGDFVIVINSDKLITTGNKMTDKIYYRHSSYPGGLHSKSLAEQMEIDSTQIIIRAISGMLPVNKLKPLRLKRLKVYPGAEHQHSAQSPEKISVGKG
ncbi:MAG TPA: 50S ribosomal protein L13 [Candidatus Saccharimonadales bacterium]|nr:50S ribosomal protein L13 [Candidatus Saccharimonadales bacterium]